MEQARMILGSVFLFGGCFFGITGAVGLLRMPDFYTRIHPAGKADTLAQTLILIGLLIAPLDLEWVNALKLVLITALLYVTAPTATHAITQAAYLHDHGVPPDPYPEAEEEEDSQ